MIAENCFGRKKFDRCNMMPDVSKAEKRGPKT